MHCHDYEYVPKVLDLTKNMDSDHSDVGCMRNCKCSWSDSNCQHWNVFDNGTYNNHFGLHVIAVFVCSVRSANIYRSFHEIREISTKIYFFRFNYTPPIEIFSCSYDYFYFHGICKCSNVSCYNDVHELFIDETSGTKEDISPDNNVKRLDLRLYFW